MTDDPRRARAAFALYDGRGAVRHEGEAEAVIGDDALGVGPVAVAWLDADDLRAGDYRVELDVWPEGRLTLSQLGRRFDTFTGKLRLVRNQARVAGLLAHGVTMPEIFPGALLETARPRPIELQLYDTHVTVAPEDGDPWQIPFGAVTGVRVDETPPAVVLEAGAARTTFGHLARRRDEFHRHLVERIARQATLLAEITGQTGFGDGMGLPCSRITGFDALLERSTAPDRLEGARSLLNSSTGDPRLGFVQLLDPDAETQHPPAALPEHWAAFLLVPVRDLTVLEVLAGPRAATYVFRAPLDEVNADLQILHFRRGPLALTPPQAELTPENPHRLALRRLAPLQRLRAATTARLIHTDGWMDALRSALAGTD